MECGMNKKTVGDICFTLFTKKNILTSKPFMTLKKHTKNLEDDKLNKKEYATYSFRNKPVGLNVSIYIICFPYIMHAPFLQCYQF